MRLACPGLSFAQVAGSYSYPDGNFGAFYGDPQLWQYHLGRIQPDGMDLRFTLVVSRRNPSKAELQHYNFTLPTQTRVAVKKVGKQTWLQVTAYGEKEFHRVVSYEKGVLVVDLSKDGKLNSKQVMIREVRIATPRAFESAGQ